MKKDISDRVLDVLWSEAVKLLKDNKCERCGKPSPLNSHHLFSRRYKNMRWDIQNGACLCVGCHFFAHQSPLEFSLWIQKIKGQEWIDEMTLKKNAIVKPSRLECKLFLEALINRLKYGKGI